MLHVLIFDCQVCNVPLCHHVVAQKVLNFVAFWILDIQIKDTQPISARRQKGGPEGPFRSWIILCT